MDIGAQLRVIEVEEPTAAPEEVEEISVESTSSDSPSSAERR